ncbi:MAG: molecular chaperone HtpG [Myxococcales bacterium]|nr:molecular chaperone HtpG [Myxococcales bacterium]
MPDTPTSHATQHEFKAEVSAVLSLVTNSLYTNREIFLRELISNAADALDKARFQGLTDRELEGKELAPKISITSDKQAGKLIIEDTGIGMSEEEVTRNLGTIAHSGTLEFLRRVQSDQAEGKKPDLNLIGQFGVGFYSAFMVADRIDVYTRSAHPGNPPVHWVCADPGRFSVAPADKETRGTRIELTLKDEAKEYLDRWRIEGIVRRYSNYVMHPIELTAIKDDGEADGETKQINEASAFWAREPKELTEEDYKEFYKHVMGGFVLPGDEPIARLHVSLDAPLQFKALLYVPGRAPADLFLEDRKSVQLYARRVLIVENCDKLLPLYMRFVRGVVDSEDLPLNVSREMVQEDRKISAIRRQLTRKVFKALEDLAEDSEKYAKFWESFGAVLKEGVHTDNSHHKQLFELLRYRSSTSDGALRSLQQYVDGMKEGQEAIYYISGENVDAVARSPHLEACRAHGYEVLFMTDAVDEWVLQELGEYKERKLVSVTQGELEMPADESADEEKPDSEDSKDADNIDALLKKAKDVLGERVKEVRASKRLRESASCLVDAEGAISRNMERILRMAKQSVPARARVLELNPKDAFVQAANELASASPDDARLGTWVELLYDQAALAEGEIADPAGMVKRIQQMLLQVAKQG